MAEYKITMEDGTTLATINGGGPGEAVRATCHECDTSTSTRSMSAALLWLSHHVNDCG